MLSEIRVFRSRFSSINSTFPFPSVARACFRSAVQRFAGGSFHVSHCAWQFIARRRRAGSKMCFKFLVWDDGQRNIDRWAPALKFPLESVTRHIFVCYLFESVLLSNSLPIRFGELDG